MSRVYLCLAHMSGNEQRFIQEAFDTNWVVSIGPNINAFEADIEQYLGSTKSVAAVSSGTSAVHLALVLLGVGEGDEVLCQSFTFAASANPVCYQGAHPVFIDSEPGTWNMSPELLRHAIEDRIAVTGRTPKAIVIAELYGMPARMDEIFAVAHEYGIPVVEDAAEAIGASYRGQMSGTFGDYGILSFNGNKMITTSGGGALICPDEESKRCAIFFATQAKEPLPYYHHKHIGYNYRLSNICAGIGRGQMTVLDDHIAHHKWVHEEYRKAFADIPRIHLHEVPEDYMDSNFWLSAIVLDPVGKQTSAVVGEPCSDVMNLIAALDAADIESRPLWKPLHLHPIYADCPSYTDGTSEDLFRRGLCLPSGPCVGPDEIRRIVEVIRREIC